MAAIFHYQKDLWVPITVSSINLNSFLKCDSLSHVTLFGPSVWESYMRSLFFKLQIETSFERGNYYVLVSTSYFKSALFTANTYFYYLLHFREIVMDNIYRTYLNRKKSMNMKCMCFETHFIYFNS